MRQRGSERVPVQTILAPGEIYEDCSYHPVLCIECNPDLDQVWGISLIDGSYPRSCSLVHCGIKKLTVEEAWAIKQKFLRDAEWFLRDAE